VEADLSPAPLGQGETCGGGEFASGGTGRARWPAVELPSLGDGVLVPGLPWIWTSAWVSAWESERSVYRCFTGYVSVEARDLISMAILGSSMG
jgi:hypothetical protein